MNKRSRKNGGDPTYTQVTSVAELGDNDGVLVIKIFGQDMANFRYVNVENYVNEHGTINITIREPPYDYMFSDGDLENEVEDGRDLDLGNNDVDDAGLEQFLKIGEDSYRLTTETAGMLRVRVPLTCLYKKRESAGGKRRKTKKEKRKKKV